MCTQGTLRRRSATRSPRTAPPVYLRAVVTTAPLNFLNVAQYEPLVALRVRHLLPRAVPNGTVLAVGAVVDGPPAGVAIGVAQRGALEIAWIYVLASKRRLGVGNALMEALETWAK